MERWSANAPSVASTTPPTCAWNTAPANGLLAPCPPSAVRAGCQGCKEAAVAYLTRHFRAGFIACLATGVATVLGVWLSGYLLCRFDPAHKRHVEAMNRYDPAAAGIEMGAKKSKKAPAVWAHRDVLLTRNKHLARLFPCQCVQTCTLSVRVTCVKYERFCALGNGSPSQPEACLGGAGFRQSSGWQQI